MYAIVRGLSLALILILVLGACSTADHYVPNDYGYEYDGVTPMGIMYRVEEGAAPIDVDKLDYYFTTMRLCVGKNFRPQDLIVISSTADVNPDLTAPVEDWVWLRNTDHNKPAMIVINAVIAHIVLYDAYQHGLVHVFTRHPDHTPEAFERCTDTSR